MTGLHDKPMNNFRISEQECKMFGIDLSKITIYENSQELRKQTPALVVAECIEDVSFHQNDGERQNLKKKQNYIMSLSVYAQLKENPKTNQKILRPSGKKFSKIYRPYIGQNLKNKTLFVSRTGGFGDLLFIQPNLIYLKEKYPTCKIIFSCGPQYYPMISTWDCIDEYAQLPIPYQNFCRADYHAIFEGVIERNKEAEKVNAYNLFSRWLGLDLPNELLIPKQKAKKDKIEEVKKILKENDIEVDKFIVIQPRASSPIRTPRPTLWKDLMEKLIDKGYKIVITDMQRKQDIVKKFFIDILEEKYRNNVFNFATYSKTIDYSIALLSLCGLCISTDSSLAHISASLGKKVFGIYGPFPGEVRLTTYPNCKFVNGICPQSPCFLHGQKPCPRSDKNGYSVCYDSINLNDVVEEIEKMLKEDN